MTIPWQHTQIVSPFDFAFQCLTLPVFEWRVELQWCHTVFKTFSNANPKQSSSYKTVVTILIAFPVDEGRRVPVLVSHHSVDRQLQSYCTSLPRPLALSSRSLLPSAAAAANSCMSCVCGEAIAHEYVPIAQIIMNTDCPRSLITCLCYNVLLLSHSSTDDPYMV